MDALYNPIPPWVYLEPMTKEDERWIPSYKYRRDATNHRSLIVVRVLRGRKMRTTDALLDELSAALQFDEPFGDNWNAVNDCMRDLYGWMPGDTYIVFVRDAQEVLCEDGPEALRTFLRVMSRAGEMWSQPITDNQQFNRPAVPFHTILKYPKDKEAQVQERYAPVSDLFAWSELAGVDDRT